MILKLKTSYKDYLLLFIICCLGFWQISLVQNIMKWDIVDINLPWRYFTSECIRNGILPLWNPYINCGFPQSADMMSWYPVSWLIGLLFGNSLITLQLEYLAHIFIGGIGMYKLAQAFGFNRETGLILSISFMFSGLFISNAQHFGWIVSAAWFPIVIYYYLSFSKTIRFQQGILFVIFLFLQLTGGYIGFFIITAYVLIGVFLYFIFSKHGQMHLQSYVIKNLALFVVFVALSSVALISFYDVSTFLTRYHQITNEYVVSGYLPLKAMISFLFPFATTTNIEFWGADFSLINCYIGIFTLIFLIYSFFTKEKRTATTFFFIGLFLLCVSLAGIFPFRKWLYYLPFMNIFRFPVIFRYFAYFAFILVAGIGLNSFFKQEEKTKAIRNISCFFLGIFTIVAVYNIFHIEKWKFKKLLELDFKVFFDAASIHDRMFLQGLIAIGLLIIFIIVIKKLSGKKRNRLLIALVVLDLIIATQLNIYQTVVDFRSPMPTENAIRALPEKFPVPDLKEKISEINDLTAPAIPFLWRSLNVFHKKTSYTGYSPYYFSSMLQCKNEGLFHSIIQNPLFFLAGSLSNDLIIDSLSMDTLSYQKLEITKFNPNLAELKVKTDKDQYLTYAQNHYPGWNVYVNGEKSDMLISNYTFMSVYLPEGDHQVVFRFEPRKTIHAFYISLITFSMMLIYLILGYFIGLAGKTNPSFRSG